MRGISTLLVIPIALVGSVADPVDILHAKELQLRLQRRDPQTDEVTVTEEKVNSKDVGVVIIDPDAGVYPMVGPGLSYDKMITGDFIKGREKRGGGKLDPSEMF